MMKLYRNPLLRRILLPLWERFNPGDITIRHHYTGAPVRLHSYRHKGYWYHGRQREAESMARFAELIQPGAQVLDVGGHIGYIALYFAHLAGAEGHVYVFEPGENNLPYLRRNVGACPNVTVVTKGAGSCCERRTFYTESLSGQNNSFLEQFQVYERNRSNAYAARAEVREAVVDVVTLDAFCREAGVRPDFIKIDVEGFELEVFRGAAELLREARPLLMIEVQAERDALLRELHAASYRVFSPEGAELHQGSDLRAAHSNTFCIPAEHGACRLFGTAAADAA